ncbi:MAG: GNAT family N-acetyltransferase [Oscillospiraceae bacterium]
MEDIIYRKIDITDYTAVRNLISDAFSLQNYVTNKKALDIVKKMYLCSCLAEQKFNRVALYQGEVVGVIMGASKNDSTKSANILNAMKMCYYTVSICLFHKKACAGQSDVHKVYGELISDCKHRFYGVLTLFAVREDVRGLGIGKGLLSRLLNYYKENQSDRIYLYTDDTCNYGFYEHMGFRRLKEKLVEVIRKNGTAELKVYLYTLDTNTKQGDYHDR